MKMIKYGDNDLRMDDDGEGRRQRILMIQKDDDDKK